MSAVSLSHSLRSLFAAAMLATIVLASAFAFVVATRLEETAAARQAAAGIETLTEKPVAPLVAMLVASVSLVSLLPALVTRPERFGMAVLGASIARMLLGMFAALMVTQVGDAPSRPVWLGAVAGLGLILVVESILAIAVLSHLERLKSAGRASAAAGVEPSQAC